MAKIDEQTLKDAVARGIPKSGGYVPPAYTPPSTSEADNIIEEQQTPKSKGRTKAIDEYCQTYMSRNEVQGRQLVGVSDEVHESLSRIVADIGGKRIPLSGYVENILRAHLSEHKELLNGDHKRRYKCLIGW